MASIARAGKLSGFHSLIIVCCHAIWLGGPTHGQDESEWYSTVSHAAITSLLVCG